MCGIAGIWGDVTDDRLRAMADALAHRGPDDAGAWTKPEAGIGLTCRRLAVIDVTGGRQPVTNEDGRIVTVFNGILYNYRELREALIARGHRFRSASDTEVIVHLYEDHGPDFTAHLRGMFAIAVWDDPNRRLLLVRDRVGKKPLYYSEAGGEFLFASELKGLLAGSRTARTLNEQAVVDYLAYSAVPAPSTIYRDCHMVEPGQCLIVRDARIASRTRYWRLTMLPKIDVPRSEAVERIDSLLHDAVRLRLRSDVPVGCFLSGGIDSGLVAAIAAKEHTGRLTTLTIGFEDESFDERPLARRVAARYQTDHHELKVRSNVQDDLERIARIYDQPFGDSSAIPAYYIAREAKRYVTVVLNGDGGDELLAGYRRYVAGWFSDRLRWTGFPAGRAAWRMLSSVLPVPRRFRSPYAFAHRLIRGMGMPPEERYLAWSVDGLTGSGLTDLCGRWQGGARSAWLDQTDPAQRLVHGLSDSLRGCGTIDRMSALDFATTLPNDLLVKIDMATMAHGLEARSPLLDHELVETAARFPERVKLHGLVTKPLLRELARRYLPDDVVKAPKRGFEVPLVRWLRTELRELAADIILARDGLLTELFDRAALEKLLVEKGRLDPARWSRRVWLLLMLGMWDRHVYKERIPASPPNRKSSA